MRRFAPLILGACSVVALVLPAAASAQIIELGRSEQSLPTPSCPADPCQAVTRTTAFQVTTGGKAGSGLFIAKQPGRIVAFTIRLGNPSQAQVDFFNANFGGAPQARISILRAPTKGYSYRLTGQSEMIDLSGYLGRQTQFPLLRSLNVNKGYIVALTTPTWLPAISLGLDNGNAWRSSRLDTDCDKQPPPASMQMRLGSLRDYRCLYRTARITYSVTEVVKPRPTKTASSRSSRR
jgi:hypothetical protein